MSWARFVLCTEVSRACHLRGGIFWNFWDQSKKLGREALLAEISKFYDKHGVSYQRVEFGFKSSKNVGLISVS